MGATPWLCIQLVLLMLCTFGAHPSLATDNERPKAQAAPTQENAVANEDQLVVTLGPPRDGIQRALVDEVAGNAIDTNFNIEDKGRPRPDEMDAYDDNFVDIREEQPIFIPRPYRNETTQKPPTTQGFIGRNIPPVTQPPQARPIQPAPSRQQFQQVRPQAAPQPSAPRPQPRPQPIPSQQPQPQPVPSQTLPQARPIQQPQPQPSATNFVQQPQPQPPLQQQTAQPFATVPPTLQTVPQPPPSPQQQRPVRPRPQPPHAPPRVVFQPQPGPVTAPNLRTGVCHASIFYISSPLQTQSRLTFTHFAVAVSVDQCARTCHEFNCAIAHFDPANGHCQFNPSTAFAVREGQCPKWPSIHFRNNVVTQGPIRIFCVQCHRPFRRGRSRSRGGRFRTRVMQPQFTGRVPSSFRAPALARSAKRSFEPVTLEDDSFASIIDGNLQRQPQATSVNAKHLRSRTKSTRNDNLSEINGSEIERKIASGMPRASKVHRQQALHSSTITREEPSETATILDD